MQPNTQPSIPLNVLEAELVVAQYRLTQISQAATAQTAQAQKQIDALKAEIAKAQA